MFYKNLFSIQINNPRWVRMYRGPCMNQYILKIILSFDLQVMFKICHVMANTCSRKNSNTFRVVPVRLDVRLNIHITLSTETRLALNISEHDNGWYPYTGYLLEIGAPSSCSNFNIRVFYPNELKFGHIFFCSFFPILVNYCYNS